MSIFKLWMLLESCASLLRICSTALSSSSFNAIVVVMAPSAWAFLATVQLKEAARDAISRMKWRSQMN